MNMTYKELLALIQVMNETALNQTATVYCSNCDEFLPISHLSIAEDTDVLDDGHFVINI